MENDSNYAVLAMVLAKNEAIMIGKSSHSDTIITKANKIEQELHSNIRNLDLIEQDTLIKLLDILSK